MDPRLSPHLRRDNGLDTGGVVDEFKEIRLLRRIVVVHEKACRDLAPLRIKHVPDVPASDPSSPRDHLPPVPIVAKQLDNAFHALLPTFSPFYALRRTFSGFYDSRKSRFEVGRVCRKVEHGIDCLVP